MDSIKKQIEGNAALLRFSGDQVTSGLRFTLLDDNGTVVSATTGAGTLSDEFHAFGGAVHGTPDYDTLHVLNDPDAFIIQSTNHSSTKTTNLYLRYEAYDNLHIELLTAHEVGEKTFANHSYGLTQYELTNHLGNVQTTVSNRFLFGDSTEVKLADIYTYADYYAYGMLKPERYYNPDDYSFSFNGMEKDDEIKGTGNSLNFGARVYDSRLGRWLNPDTYEAYYPMFSTYSFVANSPIRLVDLDGDKIYVTSPATGQSFEFVPGQMNHPDPFVAATFSALNLLMSIEWVGNFEHKIVSDYALSNEVDAFIKKNAISEHPYNQGIAYWNPNQATYIKDQATGKIVGQSPILTLSHEIAHKYEEDFHLIHKRPKTLQEARELSPQDFFDVDNQVARELGYNSRHEFFPVNYGETPYAEALNQPTRNDHATYGFYRTHDFLSTDVVTNEFYRSDYVTGTFSSHSQVKQYNKNVKSPGGSVNKNTGGTKSEGSARSVRTLE